MHKVAAFGVSLAEALEYQEEYAQHIIANAKALAEGLWNRGMKVYAAEQGFTESHTVLVDVTERVLKAMKKLQQKLYMQIMMLKCLKILQTDH